MLKNLKRQDLPIIEGLTDEERFIRNYGSFNCRYLFLKSSKEVFEVLGKSNLHESQINFINKNGGKMVLVQLSQAWELIPHFFIFGDESIPFTCECFEDLLNLEE